MVEFALVVPIFLLLVLGMLDLGRVVWANASLSNAAREGTRYAIVRGGSATTRCPVGPPTSSAVIPAASSSCPFPSPSKQGIVDVALDHAIAGGSSVTVTVCYGLGCAGNADTAGATNARGTPVTVEISSAIPLVTGSLLGMAPFTVTSHSTMVVSH